jgi:drug/metabolite transporter (DMT)-like permease
VPVLAALLAVIFLGERVATYHLVSAAFVLGGLLLARGRVARGPEPG